MNIPENILQQVADAAFRAANETHLVTWPDNNGFWTVQDASRRAVIQHALDNPALAPFLAGGIGVYTDAELMRAWNHREYRGGKMSTTRNLRAFLAALPRRESPALARDEKAEAECLSWKCNAEQAWKDHANLSKELGEAVARAEKAEAELSSQLGIIRPIAEMPETVPDGCVKVTGYKGTSDEFSIGSTPYFSDTHFAILRLPAADATPPADPEPAAQVPLGPEDVPPGAALKMPDWEEGAWRIVIETDKEGIWLACVKTGAERVGYKNLFVTGAKINTSLPGTGRWDATAWRPCSKTGKEVAK